jgi:aminopeptidase
MSMMDNFDQKLAALIVRYGVHVVPGDKVFIWGPDFARETIQAVFIETLAAGGHPRVNLEITGTEELFYKHASDKQLGFIDPIEKFIIESYDKYIYLSGEYNTRKLQLVDPERIKVHEQAPGRRENNDIFEDRFAKGEMKWIVAPYPCQALAQEAGMDYFSYKEFVTAALALDKDDPSAEWRAVEANQSRIVQQLSKVETIEVTGKDTSLRMSTKGRTWVNCCGHENLPDGEVFTGPVEDSVTGSIRFTYPGIFSGKEIEDIYLEFKQGKVVNFDAAKGRDLLESILGIEGADHVGEFAVGTNYHITTFTKNMLFDEKMGGTMHMALGMGYKDSGSLASSAIHWDILKDMRDAGSEIRADGKPVYAAGKWLI